jgi:hypothetical protein
MGSGRILDTIGSFYKIIKEVRVSIWDIFPELNGFNLKIGFHGSYFGFAVVRTTF